jgi:hypothetical protein
MVNIRLMATFVATASTRYDMGVWIGTYSNNSKTAVGSTACQKYYLYPNPGFNNPLNISGGYGQWRNLDSTSTQPDSCGDVLKGEYTNLYLQDQGGANGVLTVQCSDIGGSGARMGVLQLSTCLSWDNNANHQCTGALSALPGTGSKCRCA